MYDKHFHIYFIYYKAKLHINKRLIAFFKHFFHSNLVSTCIKLVAADCDLYCEKTIMPNTSRPDAATFNHYLSFFLQDNPDAICSKAGHAAYSNVSSNLTNKI